MLSINISELIWTIINFFLLYFLLKRFLYKPICEHMDARQARIDAGLAKERDHPELLQAPVVAPAAPADTAVRTRSMDRQQALEQLQSQSRQEDALLAEAEPALAELLAKRLLGEEADET